jgi:hypothetical protein
MGNATISSLILHLSTFLNPPRRLPEILIRGFLLRGGFIGVFAHGGNRIQQRRRVDFRRGDLIGDDSDCGSRRRRIASFGFCPAAITQSAHIAVEFRRERIRFADYEFADLAAVMHADPVPPRLLSMIERGVSPSQQTLRRVAVNSQRRAAADRQRQ